MLFKILFSYMYVASYNYVVANCMIMRVTTHVERIIGTCAFGGIIGRNAKKICIIRLRPTTQPCDSQLNKFNQPQLYM